MALGAGLWILIILVAFLIIVLIGYYNRFTVLSNRIENSLGQIDVQLKRRADLIPNLIETVKGFAKHEKEAIAAVTNARKALVSATDLPSRLKADKGLEGALGRLFAIAEGYPDLKANTNFLELQRELTSTEDKVAYSRQFYNDSILDYNNKCKTFPGKVFAGIFGFKEKEYIKITEEERKPVKVKF
ncbi:MAG: LemA family protein [Candidatus Diapherotrites archaeon ADurb.Bin253]|jgi:LemA protein|nr:LemA family protein [Candidatus Pacearchaeota archaeon]OQA67907.1 MAG: LemA family protein [Candidatus Diapherotrites archaeon ADurb.Bin253]HNZ52435.1 LemA family protein [Candidatus Pacearchaeota archaeon]HOC97334.1 LemA family protein [Candidatus Pacearchaeota archaeon]HOF44444.1 LemA family protein [Candidatus Pacearchaeota archaeon]